MIDISFKQFLQILDEGAAEDVSKLQQQVVDIDVQINQRTRPLVARKQQLQALLAAAQQKLSAEQNNQDSAQQRTTDQTQGTNTTTPGSTGQSTPGISNSAATPSGGNAVGTT